MQEYQECTPVVSWSFDEEVCYTELESNLRKTEQNIIWTILRAGVSGMHPRGQLVVGW